MPRHHALLPMLVFSALLSACAVTPRPFAPEFASAPGDPATTAQDVAGCRAQALAATRQGKARLQTGTVGLAAGATAGAIGAAATGGTYASYGAALSAGSAVVVAVPVIGVAAAWTAARIRRHQRERHINDAATVCLSTRGYVVTGWSRVREGAGRIRPAGRAPRAAHP